VEVKRAFTKVRWPFVAEKGNQRRMLPVRITATKLRMKILVGERSFEKKALVLTKTLIGILALKLLCRQGELY